MPNEEGCKSAGAGLQPFFVENFFYGGASPTLPALCPRWALSGYGSRLRRDEWLTLIRVHRVLIRV